MVGYRTFIAALLMAVFGALAILDWNAILSDPKAGWTLVASALVMAVMRALTTTPPFGPPK